MIVLLNPVALCVLSSSISFSSWYPSIFFSISQAFSEHWFHPNYFLHHHCNSSSYSESHHVWLVIRACTFPPSVSRTNPTFLFCLSNIIHLLSLLLPLFYLWFFSGRGPFDGIVPCKYYGCFLRSMAVARLENVPLKTKPLTAISIKYLKHK